jgi:hypothetical protein
MIVTSRSESGGRLGAPHRAVIVASSLGTVFEWYDSNIGGSAGEIAGHHLHQRVQRIWRQSLVNGGGRLSAIQTGG